MMDWDNKDRLDNLIEAAISILESYDKKIDKLQNRVATLERKLEDMKKWN